MEWEDDSNYFGDGAEISRVWATAHSLVFWQWLGTVIAPLGVSFHLLIEDQNLVLSAILVSFDSSWFMLCWALRFMLCWVYVGLRHPFKSCVLVKWPWAMPVNQMERGSNASHPLCRCVIWVTDLMKEETDRTGSLLKAGLHLELDCGLWALCPVSMETTYQLENQLPPTPHGRTPGLIPRLSVT